MDDFFIPDFTTSSSLQWLKRKFHPNMIPRCRKSVINILETGLLFKEDALQLEDGLQIEDAFQYRKKGKRFAYLHFSPGEKVLSVVAVGACIAVLPFKYSIGGRNLYRTLCWAGVGISIPIVHRWMAPHTLPQLLKVLSEYTILVRKCMACIRDQSLHSRSPRSMSVNALNSVLLEQQKMLCSNLEKINAALQPLFSWSVTSSSMEIPIELLSVINGDNLMKLHHLFLILQSTFLKNIALAHLIPTKNITRIYSNQSEKIYWLHSVVFPTVTNAMISYFVSLDNTYTYFKEYNTNKDMISKTLPKIAREPWQYSEVHTNIVLCSSEIRSALVKSNEMDTFLEACWNAKSKFSPAILEEDLFKLKEDVIKCMSTIDAISIQLKKIHTAEMKLLEQAVQKLHLPAVEEEEIDVANVKTVSEETELDIKDQVFYFEKNDDYNTDIAVQDYASGPGKNEIDATKIVLDELKIKLVKREDEMREREAIALENTMPEYKGNLPNFPRQITNNNDILSMNNKDDRIAQNLPGNSLIETPAHLKLDGTHLMQNSVSHKLMNLNDNKPMEHIEPPGMNQSHPDVSDKSVTVTKEIDISKEMPESSENISNQTDEISVSDHTFTPDDKINRNIDPLKLENRTSLTEPKFKEVDISLPTYDQSSSSNLLADIRKTRITRNKNHPSEKQDRMQIENNSSINEAFSQNAFINKAEKEELDEGSKPVEYRFGTGMAMASLLHIPKPNFEVKILQDANEEVFIGDGEVSDDSGNET